MTFKRAFTSAVCGGFFAAFSRRGRTARAFGKNEGGNIAMLLAFMIPTLFMFVGGAVDYSRWNAVRADMVQSMDAASLAVARVAASDPDLSDTELIDYGEKFFYENFNYENIINNFNVAFDLTDQALVSTCVQGDLKTYLLRVAGINKLNIDNCVEITKQGSGKIELALVLDVTGSMGNYAGSAVKIVSLRDAVDELLDILFGLDTTSDNLKIGVVPFNAYVNPGGATSWNNAWEDTNANAHYHGARFFHVDENGDVDMNTTVNHFDLFDSVSGGEWMGCVEARPYPLDELDIGISESVSASDITSALNIPTQYYSDTSSEGVRNYDAFDDAPSLALSTSILTNTNQQKWVPLFAADEPDCNSSYECEYSGSGTVDGMTWHGYYYDDPDNDTINTTYDEVDYPNRYFINDRNFTRYDQSPEFGKYLKIVRYFRDVLSGGVSDNDFEDFMNDLGATSYGRHEYMLRNSYVGWWDPATSTYDYRYDLSPSIDESISDTDDYMRGPNRECPAPILPLTNDRTKVDTHMDTLFPNGNTNSANGALWGWRLLSSKAPFTEGVGSGDEDFGNWTKAVVIMTDGNNTTSNLDDDIHWHSDLTAYGYAIESRMGNNMEDPDDMEDEFDNKLLRVCHRMKEENILVYTIMFGLDSTSTEQVFKACATEPSEPYFQNADNGTDLEDAFGNIAADLVDLHVSK